MVKVEREVSLREKIEAVLRQHPKDESVNLSEIAKKLGCSHERPRQVYAKLESQGVNLPPKLPPGLGRKGFTSPHNRPIEEALKEKAPRKKGEQGAIVQKVASDFQASKGRVKGVYERLLKIGELERLNAPSLLNGPREEKKEEIIPLFQQGKTRAEIEVNLNITRGQAGSLIGELQEEGKIERRHKNRSKDEIKAFNGQVKSLRDKNLTNPEITNILQETNPEISQFNVINSVNRLLRQGLIQRQRPGKKRASK